ncbi:MAG: PAS domain-containing protein [Candidatus Omnitrophica bacterium]|nr:PAS domain-containing protein [Candidatus Omnitrophota bacterium]
MEGQDYMSRCKYEALRDNMLNGYAYHEVLWEGEEPVDYVFLEVNEAFEEMTALKRDEIIGRKVSEVLPAVKGDPADWIHLYGEVAKSGRCARFERYSVPLNKWFLISAFSPEKGFFGTVFEDVTDTKTANKLWSFAQLGRIASDMAHDINNPLQVISGRAHLLLMRDRVDAETARNLRIIQKQCDKARGVVEETLKFFQDRPRKREEGDNNG